jgi:hypothetical protein
MFTRKQRERFLAKQQTQQQAEQQKQVEQAQQQGNKKKWVLPVAIIGGVAVIGTILYFVLRKHK